MRHSVRGSIAASLTCVPLALVVGCGASTSREAAGTAWGDATTAEELAIGIEFGAEEYMFASVNDVAVAADGSIYVADRNPMVVRVYDESGRHLRDIGGQGQGPGEFNGAPSIGLLQDGKLVTWDYSSSRVSFFSAAGEYLGSFPGTTGFGGSESLQLDTEDNLYVRVFNRNEGATEADILLARHSIEGERLDDVEFPPLDPQGRGFMLSAEGIGAPTVETVAGWSPLGYVVTGRNNRYEIELRKPEGTVVLRRDLEPVAVQPEEHVEWEAFRQVVIESRRARGLDAENDPDPIADTKPFFRDIFVGDDGRVWVFRYVAAEKRDDIEPLLDRPDRPLLTWREPWTYDVFEPDGTFLGSVRVPDLFEPYVFRGDRIWGSLVDADGVERVVRLRVEPGSS